MTERPTERPTLVDRVGDRWEWGADSSGEVGYRLVGAGTDASAWTREAVERLWGPVKEVSVSREPRVFQMPKCPDDVLRVASVESPEHVYTRVDSDPDYWCDSRGNVFLWERLLCIHENGLREAVETDYEAALRRLREAGFRERGGFPTAGPDEVADIRTVLIHALWGSE